MQKNDCNHIKHDLIWKRLVNLALKRGACLYLVELPQTINGVIVIEKGRASIGVNKSLTKAKRNFVLAHELGHLVLHGGSRRVVYFSNKETRDEMEKEADRFAEKLINLLNRRLGDE